MQAQCALCSNKRSGLDVMADAIERKVSRHKFQVVHACNFQCFKIRDRHIICYGTKSLSMLDVFICNETNGNA